MSVPGLRLAASWIGRHRPALPASEVVVRCGWIGLTSGARLDRGSLGAAGIPRTIPGAAPGREAVDRNGHVIGSPTR